MPKPYAFSMWQKIWSWVVVGAVVLFLLGGGVTFMTTSLPWIADVFYLAGAALFLIKFLTWEEARRQEPDIRRRTSVCAIAGTLLVTIFAIGGNHYLNRPRTTSLPVPQQPAKTQQESPPQEKLPLRSSPVKKEPHQVKTPGESSSGELKKQSPPKQITLHGLFRTDFPHYLKTTNKMIITDSKGKQFTIGSQLYMDFQSKSKFVGYFIPNPGYSPDIIDTTFDICILLSEIYKHTFDISKSVIITGKRIGEESTEEKDLIFSGRVFIYHEQELPVERIAELRKLYRSKNLDVQFKGPDYLAFKLITSQPAPQSPPPTKHDP